MSKEDEVPVTLPERAIDVLHIALPDGTCLWSDVVTADYAGQCLRAWRDGLSAEKRAQYEAAKVCGGFVVMRMLRSEYQRIPATNAIAWPDRPPEAPAAPVEGG